LGLKVRNLENGLLIGKVLIINRSAPGNAYIPETLEGVEFPRALNGKYLRRYYPSIWVDA
jgi:hypothetical protein